MECEGSNGEEMGGGTNKVQEKGTPGNTGDHMGGAPSQYICTQIKGFSTSAASTRLHARMQSHFLRNRHAMQATFAHFSSGEVQGIENVDEKGLAHSKRHLATSSPCPYCP
jgi:hypothetical protein